jgi:hypothetical protein
MLVKKKIKKKNIYSRACRESNGFVAKSDGDDDDDDDDVDTCLKYLGTRSKNGEKQTYKIQVKTPKLQF